MTDGSATAPASFHICSHGQGPGVCHLCMQEPKYAGPQRQPFKCPCCDGWGQRISGYGSGTAVTYSPCVPCGGTGIVWGFF